MVVDGYTVFRLLEHGVMPLRRLHAERLGPGASAALQVFSADAAPGLYRARWDGSTLTATPRGPSRLRDGLPTRLAVSPFAHLVGRFPKPAPPSPYDSVRLDGVATLLTDPSGTRLYESCVAGLVAWDGERLVVPPEEAPAVASVAERAVLEHLAPCRAPLWVSADWPLLLVNAAVGTCAVASPGRSPFPAAARARLDDLLRSESV